MTDDGETKEDITLPPYPENFAREIRDAFATGKNYTVTVLSAMGTDQVIAIKEEVEK